MDTLKLEEILARLPESASEALVDDSFALALLEILGFQQAERYPQYPTGSGNDTVDHAVRKNIDNSDIFLHTRANPYMLVELKGRDINLTPGMKAYQSTLKQLKKYLLSPNSRSSQWGLMTNANHIQLFRKHGKVIHPATICSELKPNTIQDTILTIRGLIKDPPKSLIVAIYNNKGGVGKTTTTINLAASLTLASKKVLVIDLDPNQKDLTESLQFKTKPMGLFECLSERKDINDVICNCMVTSKKTGQIYSFSVIPADDIFTEKSDQELSYYLEIESLRKKLMDVIDHYDYILIDAPPNWRFFSKSAVFASDVVLIPTKHNNIYALRNAALAIKSFIPQIQELRRDRDASNLDPGPQALPIFWNGEKITAAQRELAYQAIDQLIAQDSDLGPYFYPQYTRATKNRAIFTLPNYAGIAGAAFSAVPAVYANNKVREYYYALAKEYFLQ